MPGHLSMIVNRKASWKFCYKGGGGVATPCIFKDTNLVVITYQPVCISGESLNEKVGNPISLNKYIPVVKSAALRF